MDNTQVQTKYKKKPQRQFKLWKVFKLYFLLFVVGHIEIGESRVSRILL